MTAVTIRDGMLYGFTLLGYVLGVFVLGGVVVLLGVGIRTPVGALLALLGLAVIYAGALGTLYKVIADGVESGTLAARASDDGASGWTPSNTATAEGPSQDADDARKRRIVEAIRATDPATTEAIAEYVGGDEETVEEWLDRYRREDLLTARWLGGSKVWSVDETPEGPP